MTLKIISIKQIFIVVVSVLLCCSGIAQDRKYLSGKSADDAVLWDFKMSTGRNSGYWTQIPVPSNWELQGFGHYTYFKDKEDHISNPEIGYYKRKFKLNDIEKKRYRLVFQGSMTDTQVKINGKSAGEVHEGGYTQFSYDISDLVKTGENMIEVTVSKPSQNKSVQRAERFADYWIFGGIFRPVYIDILPESYIERIAVDADMNGNLNLDVYLENLEEGLAISARVFTSQHKPVGKELLIKPTQNRSKVNLKGSFSNIQPWSHEFPNRYILQVALKDGNKVVHSVQEKIGFRTFEVRDHDGFYLNNQRILLKGASMHSFRPETGRSLSRADNVEDIKLMKSLNFNTVRTPCYPPDTYFLKLCDSLGLLVLDELPGWSKPYKTDIGNKITKELVVRDVNHPSIIMWGNGNHRAHNAELEDAFLKWDIQKRRPYKNAAKTEPWPGKDPGRFDLIQTQYYPTYQELTQRLDQNQIVMPNETLHGLYDGGAGAGLADYWKAIENSKTGGGLIIWALYDEGLVRTDEGYQIDNQGNSAPDGIVGPHQEKKGSYHTVREIWSPVQLAIKEDVDSYRGRFEIENKYSFTNLNQCKINWKYIRYAAPQEAGNGYYTLAHGTMPGPDVLPGKKGMLKIPLSPELENFDAVELTAVDPYGNSLWTWRFPIHKNPDYLSRFLSRNTDLALEQDSLVKGLFQSGGIRLKFSDKTAGPSQIQTDSIVMPISLNPFVVAESDSTTINLKTYTVTNPVITKSDNSYTVQYQNINGFKKLKWTILPAGVLKLEYAYELPKGDYYYAGMGFEMAADKVHSKRWLGEGPYRVYKNRKQGTTMNVWSVEKKVNDPGTIYNFPEFEGYFGKWHWAQLQLSNKRTLAMATKEELFLGILKPNSGKEPKNAVIHYPTEDGIYFFNYISPIGEKWKIPQDLGPDGQLNTVEGMLSGTVYFKLNSTLTPFEQSSKIEIE